MATIERVGLWRRAVAAAPVGQALLTLDGVVLDANRALLALLRADAAAVLGTPLAVWFDRADAVGLEECHGRRARLVPADGSWAWATVSIAVVRDDHGRPDAMVATVDQDGDARAEWQALKDQFLAVTSHELRTPLTAILGFAATLTERWDETSDSVRREVVGRIEGQGRRLHLLVENLLTLSAAQSGAVRLDVASVDLASLAGGLDVEVSGRAVVVDGDEARLRLVVENLVANAHRYGAPPVTLTVRRVGQWAELSVSDRGPGVPAPFAGRLFAPFTQASTGSTRTAVGAGLGLAVVRSLVEAHGGTVAYRPRRGGGATFTVRLPAARH